MFIHVHIYTYIYIYIYTHTYTYTYTYTHTYTYTYTYGKGQEWRQLLNPYRITKCVYVVILIMELKTVFIPAFYHLFTSRARRGRCFLRWPSVSSQKQWPTPMSMPGGPPALASPVRLMRKQGSRLHSRNIRTHARTCAHMIIIERNAPLCVYTSAATRVVGALRSIGMSTETSTYSMSGDQLLIRKTKRQSTIDWWADNSWFAVSVLVPRNCPQMLTPILRSPGLTQ